MERVKRKSYHYAVAANSPVAFFVINNPFGIYVATITAGGTALV